MQECFFFVAWSQTTVVIFTNLSHFSLALTHYYKTFQQGHQKSNVDRWREWERSFQSIFDIGSLWVCVLKVRGDMYNCFSCVGVGDAARVSTRDFCTYVLRFLWQLESLLVFSWLFERLILTSQLQSRQWNQSFLYLQTNQDY